MSINFKGTTSLLATVRAEKSFSESNGWESTYTYKGKYADIVAASTSNAYVGNASRISVTQEDGGYGVLEVVFSSISNDIATTPSLEPETDVWTFSPFEVQRNIWEHPYYAALKFVADPGHIQKIIASVESYQNEVKTAMEAGDRVKTVFQVNDRMYGGQAAPTDPGINGATGTPLTYSPAIQLKTEELANTIAQGTETYATDKYTLRNTRILPANTLLAASTFKTGYQWTTNRVVDLILQQKTSITKYSICGELLNDFAGTYWLKKAPVISELSSGKFEIASEFINMQTDELPTELYPYYS